MADNNVQIEWVFHPDHSKQGKSEKVPLDDAVELVRTGRARYATPAAEKKAAQPTPPSS